MRKGDGNRAFQLKTEAGGIEITERHYAPQWRVEPFSNAIRHGGRVYTTIGDRKLGVAAFDITTGNLLWSRSGFAPGNLIKIGEKLLILDEKGRLALGRLREDGLEIEARHRIEAQRVWTPPTLEDGRLFLRTRRALTALALE